MIDLSIIIVSFNTGKLLKECLESLIEAEKPAEIIVVDNNSDDGSAEMVSKQFPNVILIKNKVNRGFGAANNQGIKTAKGKYILLLNSDTIVNPDAITKPLNILKQDKKIGVLGIQLRNKDHSIQQSAGYFPTIMRVFAWMFFIDEIPLIKNFFKPYHVSLASFYSFPHEVDWVTGAFFLCRKEVLLENGLFDEKMFMYVEEVDLCYRIKKAGWKVLFSPVSNLIHKKGASGGGQVAGLIEEFKGLAFFYKKHYPKPQQLTLPFLLKAGALLRIFIFGIIKPNRDKREIYRKYLQMAG